MRTATPARKACSTSNPAPQVGEAPQTGMAARPASTSSASSVRQSIRRTSRRRVDGAVPTGGNRAEAGSPGTPAVASGATPFVVASGKARQAATRVSSAVRTAAGQGFKLLRNTWLGVLAPIGAPGRYAVVDRVGEGVNLEEYPLDPVLIVQG